MLKFSAGFSLLELLTVLAITAILSATAIPSYTGYLTRAKLAELFMLADTQKLKIMDQAIHGMQLKCTDAGGTDANPLSKHIENMVYWADSGEYAIQIKAAKTLLNSKSGQNLILEFRSAEKGEMIVWECAAPKEFSNLLAGRCIEKEVIKHSC